jgi:hypothetical protein
MRSTELGRWRPESLDIVAKPGEELADVDFRLIDEVPDDSPFLGY